MSEPLFPESDSPRRPPPKSGQTVVIRESGRPSATRLWLTRLMFVVLLFSLLINLVLIGGAGRARLDVNVSEQYLSGDPRASEKIAVLKAHGTIMPPFTGRILKAIKHIKDDDNVKGVILSVDSPGGLVADSHQIYHRLQELSQTKPVYVSMERMAASGGLYIAMGAGKEAKIFAEPTTWTGSIGVIIPRYDVSKLADRWEIKSEPLKTGPFKDALSPFREMTQAEHDVWDAIMDDAFGRFVNVIADNRPALDGDGVRELATGQVYTAEQAKDSGLIDEIGFWDDAVEALQTHLGLETVQVVQFRSQLGLLELLTGSAQAAESKNAWQQLMEMSVPRAMYYCSWAPMATGF